MAFDLYYNDGTATVENGSTTVVFSGATLTSIREGDPFRDPASGAVVPIESINVGLHTAELLYPWYGPSLSNSPYLITYDSPARRSGVVVSAAVERLVAQQTALLARRADYIVLGVGTNTPPGSPTVGDTYVVGSSPTGAWAGLGGYLATWTDAAAWAFTAPETGMRAIDVSATPPQTYMRGASSWSLDTIGAGGGESNPSFASSSGTITSGSCTLRISAVGNLIAGEMFISISDNGTGSGTLYVTMPYTSATSKVMFGINIYTSEALYGFLQVGTTDLAIRKVGSGAYPIASGHALLIDIGYERNV